MSEEAKLLPCPLCGGTDNFVERADFSSCFVQCNDCGVRGPTTDQSNDEEEIPGEANAIAAWNRRAPVSVEMPIKRKYIGQPPTYDAQAVEDGLRAAGITVKEKP